MIEFIEVHEVSSILNLQEHRKSKWSRISNDKKNRVGIGKPMNKRYYFFAFLMTSFL